MLGRFTLEVIILILMLIVSVIYIWLAMDYPTVPAQFPKVISTFTLIFCIVLLVVRLLPNVRIDKGKFAQPGPDGLPWMAFSGLMIAYAVLVDFVGFPIATLLFLLCCPFLMGFRKRMSLTVIAIVSTSLLYVCMKWVLNIRVPVGVLFGGD